MTVEIYEPAPIYNIQNAGPYTIPHPYETGAIRAAVVLDGSVIDLDPDDISVVPATAKAEGMLHLTSEVAEIYSGARLTIWRQTPEEQGWIGVLGERERGLETQLDRIVMNIQELGLGVSQSIRSIEPVAPIVPSEGRALIWSEGNLVAGPHAANIDGAAQSASDAALSAEDASAQRVAANIAREAAEAAALQATIAANFTLRDIADLKASLYPYPVGSVIFTRSEGLAFEVLPVGAPPLMKFLPPDGSGATLLDPQVNGYALMTAGGVLLRPSTANARITPMMFGAVGNGVANDRWPIQASWIWSAAKLITCDMGNREYATDEALYSETNLNVRGSGAVIYITAWPTVGGFITNVWGSKDVVNADARRAQLNVRFDGVTADGSRLPVPRAGSQDNTNLWGFARGVNGVVVSNCVARFIRRGVGSGTGGAGFGDELGATNVHWDNCTAISCYRGARVQAQTGSWESGASKSLQRIRFTNFTAIDCGCAILGMTPLATRFDDLASANFGLFDVIFDGVTTAIDCGHFPWTEIDYATQNILPQKTGVIVFGGAMNVRIKHLRARIASNLTSRPDWTGRAGYPAAGTNYVGAGLSGHVGALVWGHGRNIVIDYLELDGWVDALYTCARAVAFGEIASTPPTAYPTPAEGDPIPASVTEQIRIGEIRHVRGAISYVFDGMQTSGGVGLDNSRLSIRIGPVSVNSYAPGGGGVGPNGTVGLTNVMLELVGSTGRRAIGTAEYFKANGVSYTGTFTSNGGFSVDGGYSAVGARSGMSYSTGVLRTSVDTALSSSHLGFYNTNGLVGSISTSGAATVYGTSSDEILKDDPVPLTFETARAVLDLVLFYDFLWKGSDPERRDFGVFAQELNQVLPQAVIPGGWMNAETWEPANEGDPGSIYRPWNVDYAKLIPIMGAVLQGLCFRFDALPAA